MARKTKTNRGLFDKALEFAICHYSERLRKDGAPMLLHVLRVVEILRRQANVADDHILAGALLHDILEETHAKREDIDQAVGSEVTELVALLTEDKRLPKNERKEKMLKAFRSFPDEAKLIKLADRLDNLRSSWIRASEIKERYIRECRTMLKYARGICPPIEQALASAVKELSRKGMSARKGP